MKTLELEIRNKNLWICVLGLFLAVITGCKKPDVPPKGITTVNGPYIYIGGALGSQGAYWKISLSEPKSNIIAETTSGSTEVSSIITSGNDVYIAAGLSGYFKNNNFITVTNAGGIFNIALSGTSVYTLGFDNKGNPAYWEGNLETNLEGTIGNQFPDAHVIQLSETGIAVSDSTPIVIGNIYVQNWPPGPPPLTANYGLYWTGGSLQLLGEGFYLSSGFTSTVGVAFLDNDIYVAGFMPDSIPISGYWKNGAFNSFNNTIFNPTCIISSGNDVYIGGFTSALTAAMNSGVYWKNGTFVTIAGASYIRAIAIYNNDIYVLGIDDNNNNVVWKNGTIFKTIGSVSNQTTTSMAIGN